MGLPRAQLAAVLVAALGILAGGATAAAAVEPAAGQFEGKTETGYVVSFEAREHSVFDLRFTLQWGYCGPAPVHIKGRFAEVDPEGNFFIDEGQWNFGGTFVTPTEVQGTATFLNHPLAGCPKEAVPYTARLRTGPPPVVPACAAQQLKTRLHALYPGAGYHYLVLVLENRGDLCAVRGFPRLRLRDANGKPLPTRMVHEGPAQRVKLEPREAVAASVRWDARRGAGEPGPGRCEPVAHSVIAHIPGGIVQQFRWRWGPVCKHGALRVSAFS